MPCTCTMSHIYIHMYMYQASISTHCVATVYGCTCTCAMPVFLPPHPQRSVVEVVWQDKNRKNIYRVGHKGKVSCTQTLE